MLKKTDDLVREGVPNQSLQLNCADAEITQKLNAADIQLMSLVCCLKTHPATQYQTK